MTASLRCRFAGSEIAIDLVAAIRPQLEYPTVFIPEADNIASMQIVTNAAHAI
jgi:hypothetical protein